MSSKDIMMESIADLMWTEEEVDPNQSVESPLIVNCTGGGLPPTPSTDRRIVLQRGCT